MIDAPDNPAPIETPSPTSAADRAAQWSLRIAIYTPLATFVAFAILVIRKKRDEDADNNLFVMIIPFVILASHLSGIVFGAIALRRGTSRRTQAIVALTINAYICASVLFVVAAFVLLAGVWSQMGR